MQKVPQPRAHGPTDHRSAQSRQAFGQARVRKLQARRGANRAVNYRYIESIFRQTGKLRRVRTGRVKARALRMGARGRTADYTRVDETATAVRQNFANSDDRFWRYRIA